MFMKMQNNVEKQSWRHPLKLKGTVIKALWYYTGMQNAEIDLHIYYDLNYDKLATSVQ